MIGEAFVRSRDALLEALHPVAGHELIDKIVYEPGRLLNFRYYDPSSESEGEHMAFPAVMMEDLELFIARAEHFKFAACDYAKIKAVHTTMVGEGVLTEK